MDDRPLLIWDKHGCPSESLLEFNKRTGNKLQLYPGDCSICGATIAAVIRKGFLRSGESWCLRCGHDDREPDGSQVHPIFRREAHQK